MVGDLQQREAGMLLVVGAKSAVIRAAVFHRRVIGKRHFRRFEKNLPAAFVIINVIRDQHLLPAMLRAALGQEYFFILK
jgi:hypothetical protein